MITPEQILLDARDELRSMCSFPGTDANSSDLMSLACRIDRVIYLLTALSAIFKNWGQLAAHREAWAQFKKKA